MVFLTAFHHLADRRLHSTFLRRMCLGATPGTHMCHGAMFSVTLHFPRNRNMATLVYPSAAPHFLLQGDICNTRLPRAHVSHA